MITDITFEENEYWQEKGRLLFAGKCEFMLGVASINQLPDMELPEVAFVGRSNVGKSSLINALTGRKTLARTSDTPGRTQQLNFFNLGDKVRIVDLPGYGFAKAPVQVVKNWHNLIFSYLRGRPNLKRVALLIDSRHGIKKSDEDVMKMLDDTAVVYNIILTKADKVSSAHIEKISQSVQKIAEKHTAAYPYISITSSAKEIGIAELRGDLTFASGLGNS